MQSSRFLLHASLARQILADICAGKSLTRVSLDLSRTYAEYEIRNDALILDEHTRIDAEELKSLACKENRIFLVNETGTQPLENRDEGYYKLVPTDGAPLLEISGVKMHISKGTDPYRSASAMAAQVVARGHRVLDACSGLGYAASAALELGAREVVSVELSPLVMELRRHNPWSQRIFGEGIRLVNDDIGRHIRTLASGSFDSVIHDPPRFSLAGHLYSGEFYREIHRVLGRKGLLFHYTGNPHQARKGSGFMEGVMGRLREAGFKRVEKRAELMGVFAAK